MKRFSNIFNLEEFLLIGNLGILELYNLKIKIILRNFIFQDLTIIRKSYKIYKY